ncbi:Transthyretin-like family-containing protein [Strongyloides ratti]|uniref:Transthyretin-like family-containing protein n=1 Tax=Strongyloides ratti TaxID=34506 RepID=A0A090MXP4_STRRB|nr:Transthyretin-like family-containing protein [Strongyloides ratti]CEF65789.1 Transthyretin-like family-containing protein [Strongyloides ratti]
MDEDILYDSMISEGVTDNKGYFNISGEHVEYSRIEPYIEINYKCPKYGDEFIEERKVLFVPSSVFRYLGYTREFKFNFNDIDLVRIKKRTNWYFF